MATIKQANNTATLVHKGGVPAVAKTNKSGAPTIKIVYNDPEAWLRSLSTIAKLVVFGNPTTNPAVLERLKGKLKSIDGLHRKMKVYDKQVENEIKRLSKMHPYPDNKEETIIAWRKEGMIA